MGKRVLSLYVDDEDIILAKSKNINLSKLFISILRTQLELEKEELSEKEENLTLKFKLATITTELNDLSHKFEQFKRDGEIEKQELLKQIDKIKESNERLSLDNIKLKEKKSDIGRRVFLGHGN